MNIFVLDTDPKKCAEYHCDRHISKMCVEHCQILGSIAYTARGITRKKDITQDFINRHFRGFPRKNQDGSPKPYGIGYKNHPCTQWAAASHMNYKWLCLLTLEMCKEYTNRYKRKHACEAICTWYYENAPNLTLTSMTPFAQAMPDDVKNQDPVKAYRDYYKKYKAKFAKWAYSEEPEWWKN